MADAVTTQIIENGPRNLVMKFTNVSDGVGEAGVVKVDVSTFLNSENLPLSGLHLKLRRIIYNVVGGGVRVFWDATTGVDAVYLSGYGTMDLRDTQGIMNAARAAAGVTGDIKFSTSGFVVAAAGIPASGYTIILEMIKGE